MTDTTLGPGSLSGSRATTRRRPGERAWILASSFVVLMVLAPIASLAVIAARGSGDLWPHLVENVLPDALVQTGLLLAGIAAVTTVVGVGTAWLTATCRFPGRGFLDVALLLPLSVPTYIVAYAYLDLLHPLGPVQGAIRAMLGYARPRDLILPDVRSMWGAIFILGFVLYPYVYLAARAMFLMQSASVLEVARTLGAGRVRAFFSVALPLARPAVAVGVSLALMEALNDIGASEFLGVRTLTVSIYSTWVNRSSLEGAAQIALVMLLVVTLLIAAERWARRRQRYAAQAQRTRRTAPVALTGGAAWGATLACALPVLFGFAAPVAYLLHETLRRMALGGLPRGILVEAGNSMMFAAGAVVVTLAFGIVVAYTVRLVRGPLPAVLSRLAAIGYAVPGTVLAVGLLTPLAAFDNSIDALARNLFGVSTGLILSGSGGALIFAYSVRFLAIASGGIESGFAKLSPSLDAAGRLLGESAAGVMRHIHLPLLRPALASAALLVFVDAMKELPATLLLRPFGFETLATHVYAEASRGTYEDGAVAALVIVLLGILPVALIARASRTPQLTSSRQAPLRK